MLHLTPGTLFAGDFEIVRLLAEGGMGSVYVALQRSTGKERALKILQSSLAADARVRERFEREARAGSQVDSEHVVEVVGAGIDAATGMPWLAMELLRGEDLGTHIDRRGPLPLPDALEILRQLCHGLSAAHATGLVHRDLKPENVFLAASRHVGVPFTVKLLDFGIAKVVRETRHDVTDAVGTPTWMAPEQTEAGRPISPATDVWALGLIAYALLTARPYWRAANAPDSSAMAILREVVFEPMEPASVRSQALGGPDLPDGFDSWFGRCLSRDPSARFPHARAALAALERALGPAALAEASTFASPGHRADSSVPPTVPGEAFRAGTPRAAVERVATAPMAPTQPGPFVTAAPGVAGAGPSAAPREDVDAYERRLAGGRRWWIAAGLAALALAGAAVVAVRDRAASEPAFDGSEREPNDRAPDANRVPFDVTVRGLVGQRLDAERSDRDFFRVEVPASASRVRLRYAPLPNIPVCLLGYRPDRDEPIFRLCPGAAGRGLDLPVLGVPPGPLVVAVLQDREAYVEGPPPPVLENVSDGYTLRIGPAEPAPDDEAEPNDEQATATRVAPGAPLGARLAVMRDVDVFCGDEGPSPLRFEIDDPGPRPRGTVLEVTPLDGAGAGVPVRVHAPAAEGRVTERDVRSPYRGTARCVSVTLTQDVWSEPPLPLVGAASDARYRVRVAVP